MRRQVAARLALAAVLAGVLSTAPFPAHAAKGDGAFPRAFRKDATDYNQTNAYLLAYLATVVIPENLADLVYPRGRDEEKRKTYVGHLHRNTGPGGSRNYFRDEFARLTRHLFTAPGSPSPSFEWIRETLPNGYDPEAMVISTADTLFVVFRGTDRVASYPEGSLQYDYYEWLGTDFDFRGVPPGLRMPGKVHLGFWTSLQVIRDRILAELDRRDPQKRKRLWVTGHSLGAAHSQLFGIYAAAKGRMPRGVYPFAAPHVGDEAFVNHMNRQLGRRLQRFDFVSDPVSVVPPYATGYRRAGVRNYHDDIGTLQRGAPERNPLEDLAIFGALGSVAQALPDAINKNLKAVKLDILGEANACFHHPQWYLQGAWHPVSASVKPGLPDPLPLPTAAWEGCNANTVARARSKDPVKVVRETFRSGIAGARQAVEEGADAIRAATGLGPPDRAMVIVVEENESAAGSASWAGMSGAIRAISPLDLVPGPQLGLIRQAADAIRPFLPQGAPSVLDFASRSVRDLVPAMQGGWVTLAANHIGLPADSPAKGVLVRLAEQGPLQGKDPFQVFIDLYGEAGLGNTLRAMALPYYARVYLLTDREATFTNFRNVLRQLHREGYTTDVLIDVHGCGTPRTMNNRSCGDAGLVFADRRVTADEIRNINDGSPLRLNAVYMVSCWGSNFVQAWRTLGAKAANGSAQINYYVLLSPMLFLDQYGRAGKTLQEASRVAYDTERLFLNGMRHTVSIDLKPYLDEHIPRGHTGLLPCTGISVTIPVTNHRITVGYRMVPDHTGTSDRCVTDYDLNIIPQPVRPPRVYVPGCAAGSTRQIRSGEDWCVLPDPVAAACGGSRERCKWTFDLGVGYGQLVDKALGRQYGGNANQPVNNRASSARVPSGASTVSRRTP